METEVLAGVCAQRCNILITTNYFNGKKLKYVIEFLKKVHLHPPLIVGLNHTTDVTHIRAKSIDEKIIGIHLSTTKMWS